MPPKAKEDCRLAGPGLLLGFGVVARSVILVLEMRGEILDVF